MFKQNASSGYVGFSRSVRSYYAIEDYEVPFSHINKDLLLDFFETDVKYEKIKNITVALFKYVAKEHGRTSWHHTGNRFNKTNHYSLEIISDEILDEGLEYWEAKYKEDRRQEAIKGLEDLKLTVMKSQIWGGSRRKPKLLGHETFLAVVKGDFAYPVTEAENSKYKLGANKNDVLKTYDVEDYTLLTKDYKEFKSKKRAINKLCKKLLGA